MKIPSDPSDRAIPPLGEPIRPQKPAPAPAPTETPGILRRPDGMLETQIPVSKLSEFDEEDLPYRFQREADGRLTYRCPRCARNAEYFGPAELDPTWPCGGSQWCLP